MVFLAAFTLQSLGGAAKEAGNLARSRYYKNAAMAVQWAQAQDREAPILVDPKTMDILSQFLPSGAMARLKPVPTGDGLPEGYYLIDPNQSTGLLYGKTPHYDEISKLPAVATINLNPLILARYFPGFMESHLNSAPLAIAILRKK